MLALLQVLIELTEVVGELFCKEDGLLVALFDQTIIQLV